MALSIKDPALEKLARQQAKYYGTSITQTIMDALRLRAGMEGKGKQRDREQRLKAARKVLDEIKTEPGYKDFVADMKNFKAIRDAMWE